MDSQPTFYDMAIFGGTGYIGRALIQRLSTSGKRVISFGRRAASGKGRGVTEVAIDLSSARGLSRQTSEALSYFILVGQQHANFEPQTERAILANIVRFINEQATPAKIFYASSALVYGERSTPAVEEDEVHPVESYSRFKAEAETYLRANVARRHTLIILRLGNVYGGNAGRGFVRLATKALRRAPAEPLQINGEGNQKRDYVHLTDVVEALCKMESEASDWDTVNVATGESHSLLSVVQSVERLAQKEIAYELTHVALSEVQNSMISIEKLKRKYHFIPRYTLEEGIRSLLKTSEDLWK